MSEYMNGVRELAADITYNARSLAKMAQYLHELADSLSTGKVVDGNIKFEWYNNQVYSAHGMAFASDQALACYIRNIEHVIEQLKALDIQNTI